VPIGLTSSRSGPISASTDPPVAALVLAAFADEADPALPAGLREAVAAMAGRWAVAAASPGIAFASARVPAALVEGATAFYEPEPDGLPDALLAALASHEGPVLLVAPDVPRLDDRLAAAALGDLAAGCALTFAPATDARPFLLGLRSADPELLALVAGRGRRDEVLAAAIELGGEVGLLRSERRLVTPGDARALAIDPLAPPELAELLR
jgi:hypothetical protein